MKPEHSIAVTAWAKVNLCLDVLGRRPDGYHEIDTIFQRLALHDLITLSPAAEVSLQSDRLDLPNGPKNLAYRAAQLLREEYRVDRGVEIRLKKRIPIAAGLGGGSADAAAVLRGLPQLWQLPPLPSERLLEIALALGADVPFCLAGSAARGKGIGELLTPVSPLAGLEVLLVKPAGRLSTAKVYANLDLQQAVHPSVDSCLQAMAGADLSRLDRLTGNVLEGPAVALVPEIMKIKGAMRQAGAGLVLMSGSGPTVFGLSAATGWAARAAAALKRPGWTAIATTTF